MKIEEQSELRNILSTQQLPKMATIRQHFVDDAIEDIPGYLKAKLAESGLKSRIQPGMRVVLTGSSRQISNMDVMLRELVTFVKEQGGSPVIIPAMGSHGGGLAQGQREILEGYNITEQFCGCPIVSSMETVQVGTMDNGDEVRVDRFAYEADAIIVVGRIKSHTSFRGDYESGLLKMIAIGMGKREGAESLHRSGFGAMAQRVPEYAKQVLDACNIIFGVAPIENEFDHTCRIEVIPSEEIVSREPQLLQYSKSRLPKFLFSETDVLIVGEIGKNISGAGMDPNVTGTFSTPYATGGIQKQRVVVLDIADESHGSFVGMGMADITTNRAFEKMSTNATYLNLIVATTIQSAKIPMVMMDDRLAIQAAIRVLTGVDKARVRMTYIKNTLSLDTVMVSEQLLEEIRSDERITVLEEPRELRFDETGALLEFI